jgi:hypothetical protein
MFSHIHVFMHADYVLHFFSNLNELKIAVVSQMCINQSHENLKDICPDIQELDLSGNLFNSWVPVADIAQQLVHLEVLNVR